MSATGFRAAFSFHVSTSVRVVLSLGPLQLVAFIALLGLHPQPLALLRDLSRGVVGGSGFPETGFALAALALATAFFAARRVVPGSRGWSLHLPVSVRGHRHAILLALVLSQALLVLLWIGLCLGGLSLGEALRLPYPTSFVWIVVAAAYATVPYARRWPPLVAGLALLLGAGGTWLSVLGSTICLGAVERWGGALRTRDAGGFRPARIQRPALIQSRISWVALGPTLGSVYLGALLPMSAMFLIVRNNPDIRPEEFGLVVRAGSTFATAMVVQSLASRLVISRPPWAWSRSLPWSAHTRILQDTGFLALHTLPVIFAAGVLSPRVMPALFAVATVLAARAAGAMRHSGGTMTGLGWRMTAEAVLTVILVATLPWAPWVLLLLTPLALSRARYGEQAMKVSLLRERQYSFEGDPTL